MAKCALHDLTHWQVTRLNTLMVYTLCILLRQQICYIAKQLQPSKLKNLLGLADDKLGKFEYARKQCI